MGNENNTSPDPFVLSPSGAWDGNDGRWSTFIVRVGKPEQIFKILPSTAGKQLFVPMPRGCTNDDPYNCASLRGAFPFNGRTTGFQPNASTTWKSIGLYSLQLGAQLGLQGNGLYGFDRIGLGVQNSGGLTAENQVIAGIATKDYYLGVLGLGPRPSNFSDSNYRQRSFIQTLKDENQVPSLSYAYTAGASYRMPRVPGSLTLGGFDASRFKNNNQTFPFKYDEGQSDEGHGLEIGIQGVSAVNTLLGSQSLLNTRIISVIDSTYPHIWLPRDACDSFERAFGLTYDEETDLYLVNDTIRSRLQGLNPTITFHLGDSNDPAKMVNIEVPYGAFDLQASHPIYPNSTNYFPIRRAANDTQYTLGRTFLQEAYIIADFERSNFSVYQAAFTSPMPEEDIVTILPPLVTQERTYTPQLPSGIPKGAIIGIAVGVGIVVLVLLALFICLIRRRRSRHQLLRQSHSLALEHDGREMNARQRSELFQAPGELQVGANSDAAEMDDDAKYSYRVSDDAARRRPSEIIAEERMHEMPAGTGHADFRYELSGLSQSHVPKRKGTCDGQRFLSAGG